MEKITKKKVLILLIAVLAVCVLAVAIILCISKANNNTDEITFKTLTVNENDVYGTVSNNTHYFNFSNEIQVNGNSNYVVCLDEYGVLTPMTKVVQLNEGDNIFYIMENVNETFIQTYVVTIHRNYTFLVTFLNVDGTILEVQTVEENSFIQSGDIPVPTKEGYAFEGWCNGSNNYNTEPWGITENIMLTAKWTAKTYNITYVDTSPIKGLKVTFNYNYSGSTSSTVTLTNGQTLSYPTVPTRSGYAFAGWYTNSSCTTAYNFSGTITTDTTLYAKWVSMVSSSSASSREYVDIKNYNSSSNKKTFSVTASYSSSPNYYYFTCYKSGSYTFYANLTSGDYYITVYNATQGTTIMSRYNLYGNNTSRSATFSANAGDVIYVSLYNYSSGSSSAGTFYVSGAAYPTSTATASSSTVKGYVYDTSSTVSTTVTFGASHTLPTPTRTGYTFLGWYNGNTKVDSGIWDIASDVTLTPKWLKE